MSTKRNITLAEMPPRLSLSQCAAILNCSDVHVRGLIAAKKLPAVNLAASGSRQTYLRVKRDDLATFIEKAKTA
jgi:excisionase family DNA binding protein